MVQLREEASSFFVRARTLHEAFIFCPKEELNRTTRNFTNFFLQNLVGPLLLQMLPEALLKLKYCFGNFSRTYERWLYLMITITTAHKITNVFLQFQRTKKNIPISLLKLYFLTWINIPPPPLLKTHQPLNTRQVLPAHLRVHNMCNLILR